MLEEAKKRERAMRFAGGAQQHVPVLPPPLRQRSVSMQSNLSEMSDLGSFEPDPEWDDRRKRCLLGDDIATQRVLCDLCQTCRCKGKLLVRQLGKNCIALLALFSSPTSLSPSALNQGEFSQLNPSPKVLSGAVTYQWQSTSGVSTEH